MLHSQHATKTLSDSSGVALVVSMRDASKLVVLCSKISLLKSFPHDRGNHLPQLAH